jgi:hypothetical protein
MSYAKYAKVIMIVSLLTTVLTTASGITVEGDGLELIAEYSFTGDIAERTVINEAEMAYLAGNFPFKDVVINGQIENPNSVLSFDPDGNIIRWNRIEGEGRDNDTELIGTEGSYVVNKDISIGEGYDGFKTKEVYDNSGRLLSTVKRRGEVIPSNRSDIYAIGDFDFVHQMCSYLGFYDIYGNEIGKVDIPVGSCFSAFDKGKDWFIIADSISINREDYPGLNRGTRIFDSSGDLKHTLNPNIYAGKPGGLGLRGRVFYGSDGYIIQIGVPCVYKEYEVKSVLTMEACIYDLLIHIIEVYDGNATMIWDKELPKEDNESYLFVSDNENYVGVYSGITDLLTVFVLSNGDILYEKRLDDIVGWFTAGDISEDGNTVIIFTEIPPPLEVFEEGITYKAYVIEDGYINHTFSLKSNNDRLVGDLSSDGRYILIGNSNQVKLFKTK